MVAISRILITYCANSLWMTCVCAVAAMLIERLISDCTSGCRHKLWVSSLILSSLLPITSLLNTPPAATVATADASGTISSNDSSQQMNEYRPFWSRVRRPLPLIFFAPLATTLLSVLYSMLIFRRCLSLFRAWQRTRRILDRVTPYRLPPGDTVPNNCYSALEGDARVSLVCSRDVDAPSVLGTLHPLLVLPNWFVETCSEEEIASALSHELAHVQRCDFLLNFLYEIVLLPLCFHPVARFMKRRIEHTRELACDEIAAKQVSNPGVYARSLLSIAQRIAAHSSATQSGYALSLFDTNSLEERIMTLLRTKDHIDKTRIYLRLALAAGLFAALSGLASVVSIQVAMAAAPEDAVRFAGTWEGKFKGKTFVTVALTTKDEKVSGTVTRVSFEMDASGNVTEASALDGKDEIAETTPQGNVLHLTTNAKGKLGGSDASVQYDMTLTGDNGAELKVVGAPPGMAAPKPWKLERTITQK